MRKLLGVFLAIATLSSPAVAGEVDSFQKGLLKGIEVGINFCKETTKQELLDVWSLIDSSLSYRELMIAGEVPPPLAEEKTVLEKRGGVALLKREVKFYPPAYFPVGRIQELRQDLLISKPIVIPKGWAVITQTSEIPLKKIAYYSFLAETDGSNPVYVKKDEILVYDVFQRESDAKNRAEELKRIGLPAEVVKLEKDIVITKPEKVLPLAQEVKALAERIEEKEKRLISVPETSFRKGIEGVIYYLQKALATANTINAKKHKDFNVALLKEDIQNIIRNLEEYKAENQPYERVIEPYIEEIPSSSNSNVKREPSKLELLKEKLRLLN